jgi:hypothetical protein
METAILFSEKQRFNQWWLWAIILVACVMPVWQFYWTIIENQVVLSDPTEYIGLMIMALILILFLCNRLDTEIRQDGIYIRFIPFICKQRVYPWESIEKIYTRRYHPIGEFGGWGIRGFGKNRALNVSGNQGLQIVFKDGRRLLIGTRKPDEIKSVLILLGKFEDE